MCAARRGGANRPHPSHVGLPSHRRVVRSLDPAGSSGVLRGSAAGGCSGSLVVVHDRPATTAGAGHGGCGCSSSSEWCGEGEEVRGRQQGRRGHGEGSWVCRWHQWYSTGRGQGSGASGGSGAGRWGCAFVELLDGPRVGYGAWVALARLSALFRLLLRAVGAVTRRCSHHTTVPRFQASHARSDARN